MRPAGEQAPATHDPEEHVERRVVERFGFSPWTVSRTARAFGIITAGPRKGYLCVYTSDERLDGHAVAKRNFVDADRGFDPYDEANGLVYIFAPRSAA